MKQYAMFYDGRLQFFLFGLCEEAAKNAYYAYQNNLLRRGLSYDLIEAREVADRSPVTLAYTCAAVAWGM